MSGCVMCCRATVDVNLSEKSRGSPDAWHFKGGLSGDGESDAPIVGVVCPAPGEALERFVLTNLLRLGRSPQGA